MLNFVLLNNDLNLNGSFCVYTMFHDDQLDQKFLEHTEERYIDTIPYDYLSL